MAIDVAHFGSLAKFRQDVRRAAGRVRNSARAPGIARLYAPGEPEWQRRQEAGNCVVLEPAVVKTLVELATELDVFAKDLERVAGPGQQVV